MEQQTAQHLSMPDGLVGSTAHLITTSSAQLLTAGGQPRCWLRPARAGLRRLSLGLQARVRWRGGATGGLPPPPPRPPHVPTAFSDGDGPEEPEGSGGGYGGAWVALAELHSKLRPLGRAFKQAVRGTCVWRGVRGPERGCRAFGCKIRVQGRRAGQARACSCKTLH